MKPSFNPLKAFKKAARISRETASANGGLDRILEAEARIGKLAAAGQAELPSLIATHPKDGFLRLWNGLGLSRQGRASDACQEFLAAGDLGCNHWRVGWYLAQAAAEAGDTEMAQAACEALLRAHPGFQPALELLASGFPQSADAPVSITLTPSDAAAWTQSRPADDRCESQELAGFLEGARFEAVLDQAGQEFAQDYLHSCSAKATEALAREPENVPLIAAYGRIRFHLGDFPSARLQFEKAVRLDPCNPIRLVELAATCLKLKDAPAFETALTRAMNMSPNCVSALRLLAKTHFELGNLPASARLFERIITLQPDDAEALAALDKCQHAPGLAMEIEPINLLAEANLVDLATSDAGTAVPCDIDEICLNCG